MSYKYKLGFIGAGNMAWAIASGAVKAGLYDGSEVIVSDVARERRELFGEKLKALQRRTYTKPELLALGPGEAKQSKPEPPPRPRVVEAPTTTKQAEQPARASQDGPAEELWWELDDD